MTKPLLFAVPMKDPTISKSRLAEVLDDASRRALAQSMFERTLRVISRAGCEASVLVVTESSYVASLARSYGVCVLLEDRAEGLNAAADRAAKWAVANGFERIAILPADLPLLLPIDVERLAAMALDPGQVLVWRSNDGGTNCLMASPPDAIQFRYGEGSFEAHVAEARSNEATCFTLDGGNVAVDLDTSDHLERLSGLLYAAGMRRVAA